MNAARTNAEDKLHCDRPNGNRCLPECGIGIRHAPRCPVIPRPRYVVVEALHELAWTICIAAQGDHDELRPPLLGEARRELAQRAVELIEACGG